jgi:3-deoxy-7-phosphoheptulonate synthase
MAGPCSVESRRQLLETAQAIKEAGGQVLRGGAYKPRTSPYSFQGLGEEGLEILAEARELTGLPVITEVTRHDLVPLVANYTDLLQVGARNMQNFALLSAVGDSHRPVLLKRGLSATIEELLMAAEYILSQGNRNVIVCERGIRTYETSTRNTTDINAIPVLKSLTHLPVFLDPSHSTGHWQYVTPVALAGIAAGADGLIVEVHLDPEKALSDGAQSLKPERFAQMVRQVRAIAMDVDRRKNPGPSRYTVDHALESFHGLGYFLKSPNITPDCRTAGPGLHDFADHRQSAFQCLRLRSTRGHQRHWAISYDLSVSCNFPAIRGLDHIRPGLQRAAHSPGNILRLERDACYSHKIPRVSVAYYRHLIRFCLPDQVRQHPDVLGFCLPAHKNRNRKRVRAQANRIFWGGDGFTGTVIRSRNHALENQRYFPGVWFPGRQNDSLVHCHSIRLPGCNLRQGLLYFSQAFRQAKRIPDKMINRHRAQVSRGMRK